MFPAVRRTEVDRERMARARSEEAHLQLAMDLLREVASYVSIAACIMGARPSWSREQAIIGGQCVRLYKLLSAILDQVSQHRRETADILVRLVFETGVNVRFLLRKPSVELADSYVRASLRHERKLRDTIRSNIAERGGEAIPMETRMLESLARTERSAGVSLDDVDLGNKAAWGGKHLAQKAREVGWGHAYDAVFSGMSHSVHGAWQDIYTHHLEPVEGDRFAPNLGWSHPRPQPLFVIGTLVLEVLAEAAQFLGGETALDELEPKLADLHERIATADTLHEAYLQAR